MAFSLNTQWGFFHNDRGQLIGHTSADVAEWLAAHPDFCLAPDSIYFEFGNGDEGFAVGEIFMADEADEIAIERAA